MTAPILPIASSSTSRNLMIKYDKLLRLSGCRVRMLTSLMNVNVLRTWSLKNRKPTESVIKEDHYFTANKEALHAALGCLATTMNGFDEAQGLPVVPIHLNGLNKPLDPQNLIDVNSAALGKRIHYAQAADIKDTEEAASAAKEAFPKWSGTPYVARREILLRAADIVEARIDTFVKFQTQETSCTETWARFNVILAVQALREICSSISASCTGEMPPPEGNGAFCLVYKIPVGPILAIAP